MTLFHFNAHKSTFLFGVLKAKMRFSGSFSCVFSFVEYEKIAFCAQKCFSLWLCATTFIADAFDHKSDSAN